MVGTMLLLAALAQDGGTLVQTCGTVVRSTAQDVDGDIELYELPPGRDALRRVSLDLVDGGFCAPLEPGVWVAKASGISVWDAESLIMPQWLVSSRFTVPTAGPLTLTVPREAKRTFVVKDTWGRAVAGKLAVFDVSDDVLTFLWKAPLDARGRAVAGLFPDGAFEFRIGHDEDRETHVERRTLGPGDATVTFVVERPRSVSFRALGPDGAARDRVRVDGAPADCISGLCRVRASPQATSLVFEDGRGADAFVQLPAKPADLTLPPVKLTTKQEATVRVLGQGGAALAVGVEVQPMTRPGRWRPARGTVLLPSGEREVLVRPAEGQGAAFAPTRLAVKAGAIEVSLPTAGFLELKGMPGAQLWVLPADPKLQATRADSLRSAVLGPLLAGRYTLGGWFRGQRLEPMQVEVEPGVTSQVTPAVGPVARLTLRNERHDQQHPSQVVVLPKVHGRLPEALGDPRAVTAGFGLGPEAAAVTLAASPGPATVVVIWRRTQELVQAVAVELTLTEGNNELRLDDAARRQDLGPLTEALADLLDRPIDTIIEP